MISPAYTPFSPSEAAQVLGFSWDEYGSAVARGLLERNVHFDERISAETGMHSLVDVVKCAVLRSGFRPNSFSESAQVDEFLNMICSAWDEAPERFAVLTSEAIAQILENADTLDCDPDRDPGDLRRLRALTAREWVRCYRRLCHFLTCNLSYSPTLGQISG